MDGLMRMTASARKYHLSFMLSTEYFVQDLDMLIYYSRTREVTLILVTGGYVGKKYVTETSNLVLCLVTLSLQLSQTCSCSAELWLFLFGFSRIDSFSLPRLILVDMLDGNDIRQWISDCCITPCYKTLATCQLQTYLRVKPFYPLSTSLFLF